MNKLMCELVPTAEGSTSRRAIKSKNRFGWPYEGRKLQSQIRISKAKSWSDRRGDDLETTTRATVSIAAPCTVVVSSGGDDMS